MNLEGFQGKISSMGSQDLSISVIYLSQLLGLATGLSAEQVMLHKNLAVSRRFLDRLTLSSTP